MDCKCFNIVLKLIKLIDALWFCCVSYAILRHFSSQRGFQGGSPSRLLDARLIEEFRGRERMVRVVAEGGGRVEESKHMFNILINVAFNFIEQFLDNIKVVVQYLVFNDLRVYVTCHFVIYVFTT